MSRAKEVLSYIDGFRSFDKSGDIERLFTQGYCYQFARLLEDRFDAEDTYIQYEPIEGHFVTQIDGRLYDIRGDVTEFYSDVREWYSEEYCLEFDSIVDGCMLKTTSAL